MKNLKYDVPIWKKANLTIEEAAAYFGIGMNKLRELTERMKTAGLSSTSAPSG